MQGKLRITNPILAVIAVDGHHEAITVSSGAIIETNGKKFNGERLMEVTLDGATVLMFTEDLKTSSVPA